MLIKVNRKAKSVKETAKIEGKKPTKADKPDKDGKKQETEANGLPPADPASAVKK